jgi:N-acetylmuramic acid 6-phosphate etherase
MVLAGRVYGGYMVGMNPINAKLRRRAARIVSALTEAGDAEAERLLAEAGYRIPVAVLMARLSLSAEEAEKRWREAGEDLRAALEGKQGESR